jgi:asparagine synthase (glutamine-hydrolysing)
MCGINGYFGQKKDVKNVIQLMNDQIIHRGPDDGGVYYRECSDYTIALGMRRLAIIDLDFGNQPMLSLDGSIVLVFNGEIYNFLTLKNELISQGYNFSTNSDTEVILKLYEVEGIEFVNKLDGMFAFAIYDSSENKIFVSRDSFGEKPLYYYSTGDSFYFASELKSIVKVLDHNLNIDRTALNLYFQLTYIPSPFTIYENVYKLNPGAILKFDIINHDFEISDFQFCKTNSGSFDPKNCTSKIRDLVFESVLSRSVSDVPIGTFLSGGVDSSIVSYCLSELSINKIDTFSIGFENKSFDESSKARLVSKIIHSNHHTIIVKEGDLLHNTNKILNNFDEPFADSSALPSYLLAEYTRKYVKVALTGDGADEIFSGYNKHYIGKLNYHYTNSISENIHSFILKLADTTLNNKKDNRGFKFKLKKFLSSVSYSNDFYYNILSLGFQEKDLSDLLNPSFRYKNSFNYFQQLLDDSIDSLSKFREADLMISLEGDMLTKVDRTSMMASLECRSPFLNRKILDFVNLLPDDQLINGFSKKFILKEAFKDNFPKNFLDINKQGFGIPIGDWLRTVLKKELLIFSSKAFIQKQAIFNYSYIHKIIEDHLECRSDNTFKIWTFFCFQHWFVNTYEKS